MVALLLTPTGRAGVMNCGYRRRYTGRAYTFCSAAWRLFVRHLLIVAVSCRHQGAAAGRSAPASALPGFDFGGRWVGRAIMKVQTLPCMRRFRTAVLLQKERRRSGVGVQVHGTGEYSPITYLSGSSGTWASSYFSAIYEKGKTSSPSNIVGAYIEGAYWR